MKKRLKELIPEEIDKICKEFRKKDKCIQCPLFFENKGCVANLIPDIDKLNTFVCKEIDPENQKCEFTLEDKLKEVLLGINKPLTYDELNDNVKKITKIFEDDKNGKPN